MKQPNLVRLTELHVKDEALKETEALVNSEAIVSVSDFELHLKSNLIIGEKNTEQVRVVALVNGRNMHVKETVEEIIVRFQKSAGV